MATHGVWTGREVLLWGGQETCCYIDSTEEHAGAVAYDPVADTWRRLADIPSYSALGCFGAASFLVDGRIFVWRCGRLVEYDLAGDRWSVLDAPPFVKKPGCSTTGGPESAVAQLGSEIFVWIVDCGPAGEPPETAGFAYDVRATRWRRLGIAPHSVAHYVGSAGSIYAAGYPRKFVSDSKLGLQRLTVSTGKWSDLPSPPVELGAFPSVVIASDELIVWGGATEAGSASTNGAAYALEPAS